MTPTPQDSKPQGAQLKIDRDEDYNRDYIPILGGWEIQTKGRGSSFRIANQKEDERLNIPPSPYLYELLEKMARESNAAAVVQAERIAVLEQQLADALRDAGTAWEIAEAFRRCTPMNARECYENAAKRFDAARQTEKDANNG